MRGRTPRLDRAKLILKVMEQAEERLLDRLTGGPIPEPPARPSPYQARIEADLQRIREEMRIRELIRQSIRDRNEGRSID